MTVKNILTHFTNRIVHEKLLCLRWDNKINRLLFKMGTLNFLEILKGQSKGQGYNT